MVQVRDAETLGDLSRAIFRAAGATAENADGVTRSLIGANLAGHDSHGVIRIPSYIEDINNGKLRPANEPFVSHETPATAIVDGNSTFGQVGARMTATIAARKTKEVGIAAASAFRCHHTGRIGEWAELGAREGLITFAAASGAHGPYQATPFGGKSKALGTNPFSWAIPRANGQPPILLDYATTGGAQGKLMVARARKEPVPEGWILDKGGNPTTDVEEFYGGGMLLPFAGHKGYAMSVIVEMLAVGLSGGQSVAPTERGSCLFVCCIDPGTFRADEDFLENVENIAARLKSVAPAEEFDEILLPGEPESRSRADRSEKGVPLPDATWDAITAVARDLHVTLP
ncbi:MAG: Ldh family oxidoreductase [Thermomicrobiales bacterium]